MPETSALPPSATRTLEQVAVRAGLVTAEGGAAALDEHQRSGTALIDALLARSDADEGAFLRALGEELGVPFRGITSGDVDANAAAQIPAKMATYYQFIPLAPSDGVVTIAVRDPLDYQKVDEAAALFPGGRLDSARISHHLPAASTHLEPPQGFSLRGVLDVPPWPPRAASHPRHVTPAVAALREALEPTQATHCCHVEQSRFHVPRGRREARSGRLQAALPKAGVDDRGLPEFAHHQPLT